MYGLKRPKLGKLVRSSIVGSTCGAELAAEVEEKVARIPADLNEYGYDPWGYSPAVFQDFILPAALLYRYWFRCITTGIENVPPGRCMLIGNHAGQVAFDGLMITAAMVLEAEPPRLTRSMGEYWLGTLPWLSVLLDRIGSSVGTPQTCADMLERGECILAFPEGVRGMNKVYADAYQLQEFGLGFMRLALQTRAPIVPFAVVGSEEQAPSIANLESVGRMIGAPAFPITLTWPWLGVLGMVPLPVRYHIEFGEPLRFEGAANDEDEVIAEKVEVVESSIQRMIRDGLARRESIFF
jgi:1-acyl-sn-glycerol-3-phosphate acyltransferase